MKIFKLITILLIIITLKSTAQTTTFIGSNAYPSLDHRWEFEDIEIDFAKNSKSSGIIILYSI